jgi:hypothetical protein
MGDYTHTTTVARTTSELIGGLRASASVGVEGIVNILLGDRVSCGRDER